MAFALKSRQTNIKKKDVYQALQNEEKMYCSGITKQLWIWLSSSGEEKGKTDVFAGYFLFWSKELALVIF